MNDMDAQNAAESDPLRHAGASPQQQPPPPQQNQRQRSGSAGPKRPSTLRASSPLKEGKPKAAQSSSSSSSLSASSTAADRDSDAETIVLPGKDGHSPSKVRKVRQEDRRSESDGDPAKANGQTTGSASHGDKHAAGSRPGDGVQKKRLSSSVDKDRQPRNKDGASSGLSSAPASPPHSQPHQLQHQHQHQHQHQYQHQHQHQHQHHQRRRSDAAAASLSDSEGSRYNPPSSLRDKLKSRERLPHKRKAPRAESDDEAEHRKVRRQRIASATFDIGRASKDPKPALAKPSQHDARTRSISPYPRQHRRSISTQLPFQNISSLKKKRLPPPLQPTDYQSDESSASGSPYPRNSKLRSLATPATSESHASPVKMAPHKKHLDAHGQTFLARACARGEYESVKRRLSDRPEDLNVADYAGNTPLQIAAINGCEDIVKLLIDAGCNLDCVNYDKDTPLLDAVDNGHVAVVRLLLDAGVNPRKANVNGEEPIDRVNEDTENADEIRALLLAAKKRQGDRRRTSEDRHSHTDYHEAQDSHAPDSPRHSPAAAMSAATGRRSGTVRSTKTRNDLLYMPLDDKTLRQAAGRGDEETVARILQVKEGFDDPESMVAAARGGHDLVIQLLLGLGGANADPAPVLSLQAEFATPILAAIGQENSKVVELLLEQQNFDPTRRFKGETYYEIARRRQGTNWEEEEHMLKNAYDEYKRTHKDVGKTKSPGRRERERSREEKRAKRDEAKEDARLHKRHALSPSREGDARKKSVSHKLGSPKDKKRPDSFMVHADDNLQKRGPGRPKKDDKFPPISDQETSPTLSHKPPKPNRTESDVAGVSSDGETLKPRRKLVSKGELRGERERQKRGSMTSISGTKEPSSPGETRSEEISEKPKLSEKYHDRTKALKRDGSRDRVSALGDGTAKRHRTSVTPDRPSDVDKDSAEAPVKRRRLDGDNPEKRLQKCPGSAEGKPRKPSSSRDSSSKPSLAILRKSREEELKGIQDERDCHRKESGRSSSAEKSIRVKSEDVDTEMPDATILKDIPEPYDRKAREEEEERSKKELPEQREVAKRDEERRRARVEEKRKREQAEARQREDEETNRKEQEEREIRRKREEEEEARASKLREQAERERREAEEAARRHEEEKRRLEEEKRRQDEERIEEEKRKREEEETRQREEEERRKREEEERREEEKRRREEEERKQREKEEQLHREQLEREAAEEAQRQREEEERKERERQERAHLEELERKRAAREAEQKRLLEEQERARLEKLPPLLQWLSTASSTKSAAVAEKFKYMQGARYDTIRPEANNTSEGREQWVLNTHVALLLGEKDLELSRFAAWERVPASRLAKITIWRTEWNRYSLISEKLWDLGRQLPGYYGDEDPSTMNFCAKERLKAAARDKFLNTDMFFVKVSDFMYTIANVPHLRNIKLAVEYRELLESESQANVWKASQKWKQDPDANRYHGFAPRNRYYVSGILVGEDMPTLHQTSKTPFPEIRVPRRGLVRVCSDDPDYKRICLEQGLQHLIQGSQTPPLLANGVHSSPISQASATPAGAMVNGTNGSTGQEPAKDDAAMTNGLMLNGVNGTAG